MDLNAEMALRVEQEGESIVARLTRQLRRRRLDGRVEFASTDAAVEEAARADVVVYENNGGPFSVAMARQPTIRNVHACT